MVAPERFTDLLAVGVTPTAIVAAYALVVQHGVDIRGALLAL